MKKLSTVLIVFVSIITYAQQNRPKDPTPSADENLHIDGYITTNHKIGIGINSDEIPADYKLAIKGAVIAEEMRLELQDTWPDYVFEKDYNLIPLEEVENYIIQNGHLKNIPSAKEIEQNGIKLSEMNAKLLEKIEELTLYIIKQEKRIKKLEANQEKFSNNNKLD